jgi:hypothetical protein
MNIQKILRGRWDKRLNSRIRRGREVLHLVSHNLGNPTPEKRLKTRSFGLNSAPNDSERIAPVGDILSLSKEEGA